MRITNNTNKKLKITMLSNSQGRGDPDTGSFELAPTEVSDNITDFNPHTIEISFVVGKRGRPAKEDWLPKMED